MTAKLILRELVDALPKTEYWTPRLIAAEKVAQAFLNPDKKRKVKKFVAPTSDLRHP